MSLYFGEQKILYGDDISRLRKRSKPNIFYMEEPLWVKANILFVQQCKREKKRAHKLKVKLKRK